MLHLTRLVAGDVRIGICEILLVHFRNRIVLQCSRKIPVCIQGPGVVEFLQHLGVHLLDHFVSVEVAESVGEVELDCTYIIDSGVMKDHGNNAELAVPFPGVTRLQERISSQLILRVQEHVKDHF